MRRLFAFLIFFASPAFADTPTPFPTPCLVFSNNFCTNFDGDSANCVNAYTFDDPDVMSCWSDPVTTGFCFGGSNSLAACLDASACPGGSCRHGRCVGGTNNDAECISNSACPGGGFCAGDCF